MAESASASASASKKKNRLVRPRGKRGGVKKKRVQDSITGKWTKLNIPATTTTAHKHKVKANKAEDKDKAEEKDQESQHASHISHIHALIKRIASPGTTPTQRTQLQSQLDALGGLAAYQDASLVGARAHGESGGWVGGALIRAHAPLRHPRAGFRMLDVGAIRGTAFQDFERRRGEGEGTDEAEGWMDVVSIDLHPRSERVWKADFLECVVPRARIVDSSTPHRQEGKGRSRAASTNGKADQQNETETESGVSARPLPQEEVDDGFDAVNLSLVLNFEGDLARRGAMLLRPHAFLRAARHAQHDDDDDDAEEEGEEEEQVQGGFLSLILPLPCLTRSRYCTPSHLAALLGATGWTTVHRSDSAHLTRWLLRERPGVRARGEVGCVGGGGGEKGLWATWWDGSVWGRREMRVGAGYNNFCVIVRPPDGVVAGKEEDEEEEGQSTVKKVKKRKSAAPKDA